MSNHGADGHFGPLAISVMLILGGIIWVFQQVWELMKMGFNALVGFFVGIENLLKDMVEFML